MILNDFFRDVVFSEEGHRYFYKGEPILLSASKVFHKFVEPFDAEGIARSICAKSGKDPVELIKEWNTKSQEACDLGTSVHSFGEKYAINRTLKPKNGYEQAIVNFWKTVPDFIKIVSLEQIMYHFEYKYAGTADIILINEKTGKFIIGDYKSNANIFKNYKGKRMLKPFNNLLDMPFNHYQLQLSLYQMLLEQINGVEVSIRRLIWLLPDGTFKLLDTDDYTGILKKELKR